MCQESHVSQAYKQLLPHLLALWTVHAYIAGRHGMIEY